MPVQKDLATIAHLTALMRFLLASLRLRKSVTYAVNKVTARSKMGDQNVFAIHFMKASCVKSIDAPDTA